MYLCLCSGTTESDIHELIDKGHSPKEIISKTKSCQQCKICCSDIKSFIKNKSSV